MDHDSAFKDLLTTFFVEFVELFLPDVAAYLDTTSIEFIDKEVITDVRAREKRAVDLLVKAKFRGQDTFFLIHVENQASAKAGFPKRMFRYFARLHTKYDLPVYPVVIFSYDKPYRPEPRQYKVAFPGKTVLEFNYTVIQLNRLPWRKFVKRPNPVATALMAKMKIAPQDRPKVMSECRRLLATLKLDPARSELIWSFVESYLQLTAQEMRVYEREVAKLTPEEQETTVQLMSSFRREGIQQGKEGLVIRQIKRRFGSIASEVEARLDTLSAEQLDELGEDLLGFACRRSGQLACAPSVELTFQRSNARCRQPQMSPLQYR